MTEAKGFIERVSDDILRRMNKLGISQRELAKRLEVTDARMSQLLNKSNMTLLTVERIYLELGIIPKIGGTSQ